MVPLFGLSAVGNKSLRFREAQGLVSWEKRKGSEAVNTYMKNRLPAGAVDQNTTIGGTPLDKKERHLLNDLKKKNGANANEEPDKEEEEGRKESNTSLVQPLACAKRMKNVRRDIANNGTTSTTHQPSTTPFSEPNSNPNPDDTWSHTAALEEPLLSLDDVELDYSFGAFNDPLNDLFNNPVSGFSNLSQNGHKEPSEGQRASETESSCDHVERPMQRIDGQDVPSLKTRAQEHVGKDDWDNEEALNDGYLDGPTSSQDHVEDWYYSDPAVSNGIHSGGLQGNGDSQVPSLHVGAPHVPNQAQIDYNRPVEHNKEYSAQSGGNLGQPKNHGVQYDTNSSRSSLNKKRKHENFADQSVAVPEQAMKRQRPGVMNHTAISTGHRIPLSTSRVIRDSAARQRPIAKPATLRGRLEGKSTLQPYHYTRPTFEMQTAAQKQEAPDKQTIAPQGVGHSSKECISANNVDHTTAASSLPSARPNSNRSSSETVL